MTLPPYAYYMFVSFVYNLFLMFTLPLMWGMFVFPYIYSHSPGLFLHMWTLSKCKYLIKNIQPYMLINKKNNQISHTLIAMSYRTAFTRIIILYTKIPQILNSNVESPAFVTYNFACPNLAS
jgi:hypothetical protein